MKLKLLAGAVAAVFALPAYAGGDKAAAGSSVKPDGGAEAMFKNMDKNKDGFVSRDEAKGTPHEKDFAKLDKNNDGKLSAQEHAGAPEHAGNKAASGASAPAKPADSNKKY